MTDQQPTPHPLGGGLLPSAPAAPDGRYRMLFVHAHPDDETIVTGATMAHYAAAGVRVALLTCTRGELGEVIPPELAHLEVAPGKADDGGAALAAQRSAELSAALAALGVRESYWLGSGPALADGAEPVLYRDSGMQWGPDGRATAAATVLPGSLSRLPLHDEAGHAAALIRRFRPDAVITYAKDGGYGHPDHVRTHELTLAAVELAARGHAAAVEPATPAAAVEPATLAAAVEPATPGPWDVPLLHTIVSDRPKRPLAPGAAVISLDGPVPAKTAAMRAHRTQITVADGRYALSDGQWKDIEGREIFRLLRTGNSGPAGNRR